MDLTSGQLLRVATLAAAAAIALSNAAAQVPGRSSPQAAPPPVPAVVRPAEGQVVTGNLLIAVQVPSGVPARRYTIEGAYVDPVRGAWVYPGTLGASFAGGATAQTQVAASVRARYDAKATRWRIRARVDDPPGGWGPWREFTWQDAPQPRAPEPASPQHGQTPTQMPNPGPPSAGASPQVPSPGPPTMPKPGPPATGAAPQLPNPGPPGSPGVQQPGAAMPDPGPPTMPNPGPPGAPDSQPTPADSRVNVPNPGPPNVPSPGPPGASSQAPRAGRRVKVPSPGPPNLPNPGPPTAPNPGPPDAPASGTAMPDPGPPGMSYPSPGPPGMSYPSPGPPATGGAASYPNPGPPTGPSGAPVTAARGASYPNPGPPNLPNPGPPDVPSAPGLLQWFDASVKKRAIVGSGGGSSAAGRLGTAREMLASASALLERGKQPEACAQLQDLAARADGMASPADLVEGPEAKALIARIAALRGEIGCQ